MFVGHPLDTIKVRPPRTTGRRPGPGALRSGAAGGRGLRFPAGTARGTATLPGEGEDYRSRRAPRGGGGGAWRPGVPRGAGRPRGGAPPAGRRVPSVSGRFVVKTRKIGSVFPALEGVESPSYSREPRAAAGAPPAPSGEAGSEPGGVCV